MNLTLDANIWVGAFDPGDSRQPIYKKVLKDIFLSPDITVFSPYLMEVEVLASMTRKFRGTREIKNLKHLMRSHPRHHWFVLDYKFAQEAARCATTLFLRGADAVYVATALSNNSTLVTFDREIIDRASSAVDVIKPDQWLEMRA